MRAFFKVFNIEEKAKVSLVVGVSRAALFLGLSLNNSISNPITKPTAPNI